jgi:MFS family permease
MSTAPRRGLRNAFEATVRPQGTVFFGWWIVAAGAGIQVLGGALLQSATGAYLVLLQDNFGWSKASLSGAFSLARLESGILGPLQGWMVDRYGPRNVMRLGIVMFGLGFIGFSQIHSLPWYYVTYFLMAIGQSLGGFLSATVALVRWFSRHRAKALAISQIGFSVGGLMAPAVVYSMEHFGWRETAFVSGLIIIVIGLPLTQVVRMRSDELGELPDGLPLETASASRVRTASGAARAVAADGSEDFTPMQAIRTPAFWLISLGHASALLVVSVVQVHLIAHLHEDFGFSLASAATVVLAMQAFQMFGQISGGFLGDRFDKRVITVVCMLMHATALVLVAYFNNILAIGAFAVLHGLGWGIRGPLMQAIRADYFGAGDFGKIMGWSSMIVMIGTVSGPFVAGFLADKFGSYQTGFAIIAGTALAGSIFFILARKPEPPNAKARREREAQHETAVIAAGDATV